jgi:hypothetical protein
MYSTMPIIGPQIPPELLNRRQRNDDDDEYAPQIPPETAHREEEKEEDSTGDEVGPMPLPSGVSVVSDPVLEFMEKEEKRRKQVKVRRSSYSICCVIIIIDRKQQDQKFHSARNGCSPPQHLPTSLAVRRLLST